ncbi:hypothetical protein WME85_48585 [Sorangium sp. So ce1153]
MQAHLHPLRGLFEQLGPIDPGGAQVIAEAASARRGFAQPLARLVHEQGRGARERRPGCFLTERDPRGERPGGPRGHRPGAGVVCFVRVERDGAAGQVDVAHVEPYGLREAHPLAVEEAVQDAPAERDVEAGEEPSILVRVDPALGLGRAHFREEAPRERVRQDEPQGEDGHREEPVQEHGDASTRRGSEPRRKRAHDRVRMVDGERVEGHASGDRVDVALEALHVVLHALLHTHVVRVRAGKLARRPALTQGLEGDRARRIDHRPRRAATDVRRGVPHLGERLPLGRFARTLD